MTHMQGIGSILRSDNPDKRTEAASLRRTLSADMSSKIWLADNGLPLMKNIAIDSSSSASSREACEEKCEAIGKKDENLRQVDIWTAIMSQKKEDESVKLSAPYVHPLVKKSARSLSEMSLKVCTESLGSETGSDVFSSDTSSQGSEENTSESQEEHKVGRLGCLTTKKSQQVRSFPPPLPSLAATRTDGSSLQMHSRRVDGRLVLEAVTVPPQKYFEAQRQDGRFLLTLIKDQKEQPPEHDGDLNISGKKLLRKTANVIAVKHEDGINKKQNEDEMKTDSIVKDIGITKERQLNSATTKTNVEKYSTVTIKRIMERENGNLSWSRKLNTKKEKTENVELSGPRQKGPGLPPLPRPTANSVNSYEYFWRAKTTVASVIDPLTTQHLTPTKTKDLVLVRGNKADCLLPNSLKSCKEPRRSHLMWEPFCIATS